MLNYKIIGEGYPVIFLHGFLESNSMWNYLSLHELKFQSVLIELPGHGLSDELSQEKISIKDIANEIKKLICHLNIEKFSVVGHSLGGYVALELAQKSLQIDKIVLLNSNCWTDDDLKKKQRIQIAKTIHEIHHHFIRESIPNLFFLREQYHDDIIQLIDEARKINPSVIASTSLAMCQRINYTQFVIENLKKFYIIQGENDLIVDRDKWPQQIQESKNFHLIKNCGHMSHIEQSSTISSLINEIINCR